MNIRLMEQLLEEYPSFFPEGTRYLDCGDGWYWMIDITLNQIQNYLKTREPGYEDFQILQLKEKFGALRIYTNHYKDGYIDGIIHFAETLSTYICERCGAFGGITEAPEGGWLKCLCSDCLEKQNLQHQRDQMD